MTTSRESAKHQNFRSGGNVPDGKQLDGLAVSCETLAMRSALIATSLLSTLIAASAQEYALHSFKKIQLSDLFWSEGANYGDFNKDGAMDVVSGPYWWEGPDFKVQHEYSPATKKWHLGPVSKIAVPGFEGVLGKNNTYSDNFFAFSYDFNKDGWDDILIIGFPGKEATWYENPKKGDSGAREHWTAHKIFGVVDNESPTFADLTGDRLAFGPPATSG